VSVKRRGLANAEKTSLLASTKMARCSNPSVHLRNTYIALTTISNLYFLNRRVLRAPDCFKYDRFHHSDVSLHSPMALADLSATRSPSQMSVLKTPSYATRQECHVPFSELYFESTISISPSHLCIRSRIRPDTTEE